MMLQKISGARSDLADSCPLLPTRANEGRDEVFNLALASPRSIYDSIVRRWLRQGFIRRRW